MKMDYQNALKSIETPFSLNEVEVTEDGQNVMRPDVMNFLMLASIASQAVKIRKYFDDRTPNGYIQTRVVAATQVRQRIGLTWDAQSAALINDGPDSVWVWVNTIERPPHQMNLNEVFNIDFEVHKLKRLFFQCDPGDTTSVRIVAQD